MKKYIVTANDKLCGSFRATTNTLVDAIRLALVFSFVKVYINDKPADKYLLYHIIRWYDKI